MFSAVSVPFLQYLVSVSSYSESVLLLLYFRLLLLISGFGTTTGFLEIPVLVYHNFNPSFRDVEGCNG
jgi:hypothetical protein